MCWVIGPKNLITALSQSGAPLDFHGNESVMGSHRLHLKVLISTEAPTIRKLIPDRSFLESVPLTRVCRLQLAAVPLLDPDHVAHERVGLL